MDFPNQSTFKSAIADLKEIVIRNSSGNTESIRAIDQLESMVADIERKCTAGQLASVRSLATNPVLV